MANAPDPNAMLKALLRESDWLKNHPEFSERPASIREFLGDRYLNIEKGIRPGLMKVLIDIFGEESNPYRLASCEEAMMTGAIGIGKTTFASIALPYMAHWVLCLKNPQEFFGLLPGSRIAFMQMSTSEDQAREVIFADIFARIRHSPWFKKYPFDEKYKNQIRFHQKDIWIIPGDSAETTFEGYNILGGILDEMDSHRVTPKKDYAQEGYNTISNRISSRFQDRGLLILIGQMKKSTGFAANMMQRMLEDQGRCYVARLTLWESFGWDTYLNDDGTRNSFWFDKHRKIIVPNAVGELLGAENPHLMEIPNLFKKRFLDDPDKALKDLAGIPPIAGTPFISMPHKLDIARDKWHERFGVAESPTNPDLAVAKFAPWLMAKDKLKRAIHIDIAYSSEGDALGMAMGHVREMKEVDGENVPVIVFDMLLRMRPMPGTEIILGDIRKVIYHLRDDLGFKINKVTLDGFQSTDTIQQLQKRRFDAGYLSVDRSLLPYQDLRDAINEERIEFPRYVTYMKHGDSKLVDIAYIELTQLIDNGKKVDHPVNGSKDLADAMAGVCHSLAGDRQYHKKVSSSPRRNSSEPNGASEFPRRRNGYGATSGAGAFNTPVIPRVPSGAVSGIQVPSHLMR